MDPHSGEHRGESGHAHLRVTLLFLALLATVGVAAVPGSRDAPRRAEPVADSTTPEPPGAPAPHLPHLSGGRDATERLPVARAARIAGERPAEPRPEPAAAPSPDRARVVVEVRAGETSTPLANARVELGHTAPGAEEETLRVRSTDSRGRLEIELPAGTLRLVAWRDGAVAGPDFLELEAGGTARATLATTRAQEIAGRVVEEATGEPVAGAEVAVWTFSERDVVTTGADGSFRHPRFPRNGMAEQVRVRAPGYGATVRYLVLRDDGSWELPDPLTPGLSHSGGGTPWLEVALVPELAVRGVVVDVAGTPVPDARVEAEGYVRVLPSVASLDGAVDRTDEDGTFHLDGMRSDVGHGLSVRAPGFAELALELAPGTTGSVLDLGHLVLEREATLAGLVVDAEGRPVRDALVVVSRISDAGVPEEETPEERRSRDVGVRFLGGARETRTDEVGTFRLEGLPEARYAIEVARDAGTIARAEAPALEARTGGWVELALPAGSAVLRGRVLDASGTRKTRVRVERFGEVALVPIEPDGSFRVAGVDGDAPYRIALEGAEEPAIEVWAHEEARLVRGTAELGPVAGLAPDLAPGEDD